MPQGWIFLRKFQPDLTPVQKRKIEKILKSNGFVEDHTTGSHRIYKNNGKMTVVPLNKKEIDGILVKKISQQSGIPIEEFYN